MNLSTDQPDHTSRVGHAHAPTGRRIRLRFGRSSRLRRRRDFDRVFGLRCSVADERIVVYAAPNGLNATRLGMSVSRKIGNAVKRNRIKRLIREAFRRARPELPGAIDIVVVARPNDEPRFDDYRLSLKRLVTNVADKLERRGLRTPPKHEGTRHDT